MEHRATPATGGCLCGRVRYQADVFLRNGCICHCTTCQRSTGQPAEITAMIKAGTLRYLRDQPRCYVSSHDGKRGFCGRCGSRIVWQALRAEDDCRGRRAADR
ncbi:MAG: GFA family protein [Rhodobacter sp.]|nr:GFA family protein [Rhodobacter sp.]